jgi:hypothetical protein
VGVLERIVECADRQCDHAGAETVGPHCVSGDFRADVWTGSGEHRSAYPKARVVALAECGTHAFVAAALDA